MTEIEYTSSSYEVDETSEIIRDLNTAVENSKRARREAKGRMREIFADRRMVEAIRDGIDDSWYEEEQ